MSAPAIKRRCSVCHASYAGGEAFCPRDGGAIVADDPAGDDDLVGKTIDGRYLVSRMLGRGGMGKVYEAEHVGLGKRVAIKFVSEVDADREHRARFRQEARAASQIVHENVVQIFDVGVDAGGRDFIVMEYVEGRDLDEVIASYGPLPPWRAIAIARQLLRGLHASHEAGIVHRDIKPANIRLTGDNDFVKIMDFGIAKSVHPRVAQTDTGTGRAIGTPQFMAPEQILDAPLDRRADLYAVGATLYAMLTGQPPFASASFTQRMSTPEIPSVEALRSGLPVSLVAAISRAMQREPADRFADAPAFAAALEDSAALARARMDAPTAPISYPGARPDAFAPAMPRRSSLLPVVIVLAVLLAGAAGAVIYLATRRPPAPPAQHDPVAVVASTPDARITATPDAAPPDAATAAAVKDKPKPKAKPAPEPIINEAMRLPTVSGERRCACKFTTPHGSISYACAVKRDFYRCSCQAGGSNLCPQVIWVEEDHEHQPDGHRGGAMHCIDRTRGDCNPLDGKAMPESCRLYYVNATSGVPKQGDACRGYTSGMTERDPPKQGAYQCSICDFFNKAAPKYAGADGDSCTGYDPETGGKVIGVLDC